MSRDSEEIVKRGLALANAGDWNGAFAMYRADAEYRDLQHGPDQPEVLRGLEQIRGIATPTSRRR
jgi:ketosteroid isomerase-like protein